ncbi:MAG: hypothetical protein IKI75_06130, partial [Lachnospiraceae bacterium]|nr:hypothetical protein [Lachnospiraceae bacterium]
VLGTDINRAEVVFLNSNGSVAASTEFPCVTGGVKPLVRVTLNGMLLTEKADYTLSYEKNYLPGTASVIIKGKKNYSSSKKVSFTVVKQNFSRLSLDVEDIQVKGTKLTEGIKCKSTKVELKDTNGKTLTLDEHYTLKWTYMKPTSIRDGKNKVVTRTAGSEVKDDDKLPLGATLIVTASPKGDSGKKYSGTKIGYVRLYNTSISGVKITIPEQYYNGFAIEPDKDDMTITKSPAGFNKDSFDIIGYRNNVKKGTASVIIRGNNDAFGGTKVITFKIKQRDFTAK